MDTQTVINIVLLLATYGMSVATGYLLGYGKGFQNGLHKQLSKMLTDYYKKDEV